MQAGFAKAALEGVGSWFYATAEVDALAVDTGGGGHAVSDPSGKGAHQRPEQEPLSCFASAEGASGSWSRLDTGMGGHAVSNPNGKSAHKRPE